MSTTQEEFENRVSEELQVDVATWNKISEVDVNGETQSGKQQPEHESSRGLYPRICILFLTNPRKTRQEKAEISLRMREEEMGERALIFQTALHELGKKERKKKRRLSCT